MSPPVVHLVAGARPNFMKVAPLHRVLSDQGWCRPVLVHTGQHYDPAMSDAFLRDLGLPEPDVRLGCGSGSHAAQTAAMMVAYEGLCLEARPDWVVVVGDVNSTLAAAITAKKLNLPVAHLEAGLRSGDRAMPEEINRIAVDAIADLLWTPSEDADANLRAEGIAPGAIERVGNVMIDSLEMCRPRIEAADAAARLGVAAPYGVVTLHRPANVDDPATLDTLLDALADVAGDLPLVFPVHPRTRRALDAAGLARRLDAIPGLRPCEPLGYVDFMSLLFRARLAITDSGGLQEETSHLGIPCLTLRPSTERPVTVTQGTNRLVNAADLSAAAADALDHPRRPAVIPLWDGRAAERAALSLRRRLEPVSPRT